VVEFLLLGFDCRVITCLLLFGCHIYKSMRSYYAYKINMAAGDSTSMQGKLIVFRVYKNTEKQTTNSLTTLNRFVQKFYGQDTTNHGGKYKHHRKGLLEDIPHIKLIRGVIIVRETDLEKILNFLNTYNAETWTRDITLTPEDEKTLTNEP